jgi:hypothetical protein
MDRYQDSQSWASDDEELEHHPMEHEPSDEEVDEEEDEWLNLSSQHSSAGLWIQILWQHPLVFWGGIWAIVFFVAGLAFTGLISPYLSSQTDEPVKTSSGQPSVAVKPERDTLPVWSVGAIAAACAAGSLLISQRMKYQNSRQSLTNHHTKVGYSSPASGYPLALPPVDSGQPTPLLDVSKPLPVQPFQPTASMPISPSAIIPVLPSAPEEPIVTIVPADEATPLDWPEASLADMMDIRYRRQPHR